MKFLLIFPVYYQFEEVFPVVKKNRRELRKLLRELKTKNFIQSLLSLIRCGFESQQKVFLIDFHAHYFFFQSKPLFK